MPTVDKPKLQAPMEAANPAPLQQQPGAEAIVATQPVSYDQGDIVIRMSKQS